MPMNPFKLLNHCILMYGCNCTNINFYLFIFIYLLILLSTKIWHLLSIQQTLSV